MHRPGLVFACLFVATGGASAASPNPEDLAVSPEIQVRSRALVRQLGSADFAEREDAEKQLALLGRLAYPALTVGATTSPDPEIRFRCHQLLPRAATLDSKARLDTFLADTKSEYEHNLHAWKEFRAIVGTEWAFFGYTVASDHALDTAARRVFTELVSTSINRRLLMAIDGSRIELADLVVWRRQELYNQRYPRTDTPPQEPTLEDVTVLLFAESRVGSQYFPRRGSISSLLNGSDFSRTARGTDEKSKVYRAVAIAWLDSRNEPREMSQALSIAQNLDLNDQACGLAARLLTTAAITPSSRGRGAARLAAIGTKKHISLLEKALADPFVVYSVPRTVLKDGDLETMTYDIQVRDLALAVSILLAEQKLEDYGFTDRSGGSSLLDKQSFSYTRHYFPDDAARKAAFAKWEKWRHANRNE